MSELTQTSFDSLGIDEDLLEAIHDLGYQSPTPIQAQAITELLMGVDLIGQSQTGTGKTAAFAIPMIELIDPEDRRLQAVVLCPTRELCMQNAEEIRKLLKYKQGIRVLPVYGGQPINRQISDMRGGVQILTATPGRLLDHLRRHTLKLDQVVMAVLDEADEMISMGFKEDIDLILAQMPPERQTVLFSATMPDEVKAISGEYMDSPVEINLTPENHMTVADTEEFYLEVKGKDKTEALLRLLSLEDPERALIFCNTKKKASDLSEELKQQRLPAEGLHGDLKQVQRDLVMRRFKTGDVRFLVATDVAARGLDIHGIDVVFNYDLPEEDEAYVHRIGRTGRAGNRGKAYTFVSGKEIDRLRAIGAYIGQDPQPVKVPTLQEVAEVKKQKVLANVKKILDGSSPDLPGFKKHLPAIESLLSEGYSEKEIAAALLSLLLYVPSGKDGLNKAPTRLIKDPEKTVRLFVSLGRRQKLKVKDLIQAVSEGCGVPAGAIGHIEILETFSYMEVPMEISSEVVSSLDGSTIKGLKVHVELAK